MDWGALGAVAAVLVCRWRWLLAARPIPEGPPDGRRPTYLTQIDELAICSKQAEGGRAIPVLLTDALRVAGSTRNSVNYWRSGGFLTTQLVATQAGVARPLSMENVLEIAFMAAATGAGMTPSQARGHVRGWLNQPEFIKARPFFAFRPDGHWIRFAGLTSETLAEELGAFGVQDGESVCPPVVSFSVINLGEIVRRVGELFGRATE